MEDQAAGTLLLEHASQLCMFYAPAAHLHAGDVARQAEPSQFVLSYACYAETLDVRPRVGPPFGPGEETVTPAFLVSVGPWLRRDAEMVSAEILPILRVEMTVVAREDEDEVPDVGEHVCEGVDVARETSGSHPQGVDGGERYGRVTVERSIVEHHFLKAITLAGLEEHTYVALSEKIEAQRAESRKDVHQDALVLLLDAGHL